MKVETDLKGCLLLHLQSFHSLFIHEVSQILVFFLFPMPLGIGIDLTRFRA